MSHGGGEVTGAAPASDPPDARWRQLDRRAPLVRALVTGGLALGGAVPISVGLRGDDRPGWQVLLIMTVGVAGAVCLAAFVEWLRLRHTRYRVTGERVELRFAWVVHRFRSIPRDRIRTVDLTANLMLRAFGVVKVQIGTGQQTGDNTQLVLSPLDRQLAEQLRRELLSKTAPSVGRAVTSGETSIVPPGHPKPAPTPVTPADPHGAVPAKSGITPPVPPPGAGSVASVPPAGGPTGSARTVSRPVSAGASAAALADRLSAAGEPRAGAPEPGPIVELNWSWIRYAPISVTTPILGVAAFGGLFQIADWFGLRRTIIGETGELLRGLPILVMVAVLVVLGVVVGVIGSLGLFVELWSGYRLTREDGLLRVRRGLLTTRSLSLDERRLRGVEVVEPLGARLVGAARVDAVATGLRSQGHDERSDPKTLLPAAPRELAHRVAAQIVNEPASPTTAVRLRPHPVAARGRRLRWAITTVLLLSGALAFLGMLLADVLLHLAWLSAVIMLPLGIALAIDAYRNLGHGITGEFLVTRYGPGSRHTIALQRSGVIGWTITSSPFQRRAGLLTLGATTAASKGVYLVRDIGESEGLAFAEDAVPGVLTPFLERR